MQRYFAFLLLAWVSIGPAAAQPGRPAPARVWDVNHNIWLCYFSDADLYRKWDLHTEFQYRRTHGLRDPQQYFYRAGANYRPTKGVLLTGATCTCSRRPLRGVPHCRPRAPALALRAGGAEAKLWPPGAEPPLHSGAALDSRARQAQLHV
ncbi:MAG: DUF2490 domain-containing protein [Hymenobacter sp.]